MKIGYIGLGKMGLNMTLRLLEKGHEVIAYDPDKNACNNANSSGIDTVLSLEEMAIKLGKTKLIWIMVPHKFVDDVLNELELHIQAGDTVIDGGNSPYKDTVIRSQQLSENKVDFLDCGVSGGPSGARDGACLMIGGKEKVYQKFEQLFKDIAAPKAYGYMGDSGAGHYVKMVHNGIEYGMMQAIGEGFEIMKKSDFKINLTEVTRVYNNKSVIESRLTKWLLNAYKEHGEELKGISGEVSHSGEGQWTVETAEELDVPTPIIKGSLQFREDSQGNPSYTGQVVSALRNQFGGHDVT